MRLILIILFFISVFSCKKHKYSYNDVAKNDIWINSNIHLDTPFISFVDSVLNKMNVNDSCIILIYLNRVSYDKTIITILDEENVPFLSKNGLPFIKTKIGLNRVFIYSGIEKYLPSMDTIQFVGSFRDSIQNICNGEPMQYLDSLGQIRQLDSIIFIPFH